MNTFLEPSTRFSEALGCGRGEAHFHLLCYPGELRDREVPDERRAVGRPDSQICRPFLMRPLASSECEGRRA